MKLVDRCLQSETLKRKLQGLNELKDIVKSVTYGSERNKAIVNFSFILEKLDQWRKAILKDLSGKQPCTAHKKIIIVFQVSHQLVNSRSQRSAKIIQNCPKGRLREQNLSLQTLPRSLSYLQKTSCRFLDRQHPRIRPFLDSQWRYRSFEWNEQIFKLLPQGQSTQLLRKHHPWWYSAWRSLWVRHQKILWNRGERVRNEVLQERYHSQLHQ